MNCPKRALTLLCMTGLMFTLCGPAVLAAEPATPTVQPIQIQVWDGSIYMESVQAAFGDNNGNSRDPFIYDGTVYIPLRTAGEWLGGGTIWTKATKTAALTSKKSLSLLDIYAVEEQPPKSAEELAQSVQNRKEGMDAELRPDLHITLDGVEQHFTNTLGTPIYPILFRDCVYLPVRNVGMLCGKRVLLFDPSKTYGNLGNTIYLFAPATQEELETAQFYLMQCTLKMNLITTKIEDLSTNQNLTKEQLNAKLEDLEKQLQALNALPRPALPPMKQISYSLYNSSKKMIEALDTFLFSEQNSASVQNKDSSLRSKERFLIAMKGTEKTRGEIDTFLYHKTWGEALLNAILANG